MSSRSGRCVVPALLAVTLAAPAAADPRPLPPTFVSLEIEAFPRPAAEACADNTQTLPVPVGGSIAAALESAVPGTTVLVEPGRYVERPEEPTALQWDVDNVCLRAADSGEVILEAAPGQGYGIGIAGDAAVLEGFTLRGFQYGVQLGRDEGETQRGVTLERVRVEQLAGEFREGVVAYTDNRFVAGTPAAVDGLLLLDVGVDGADLGVSCNGGPCYHWWLERTVVVGRSSSETSGADAFAIEEGRQIVVVDSTFSGVAADGIDTKANDVVVFGARVLNVDRNAIKLWRGGDVIDCVVDGSGADASLVGDQVGRYRYLHLLVTRHGEGETGYLGTWAYDSPGPGLQLEIINSIFRHNATGGFFVPQETQLALRHNLFDDTSAKLVDVAGDVLMVADLAQLEAQGWGAGNAVADALLVDPTSGDYSTQPGSPARDAGEVVEGLDRDLLGGPRSLGAGPDIGPVESQP
jgi:hypothetical protein